MTYISTQNDRRVPREKKGWEVYRLTTNKKNNQIRCTSRHMVLNPNK